MEYQIQELRDGINENTKEIERLKEIIFEKLFVKKGRLIMRD